MIRSFKRIVITLGLVLLIVAATAAAAAAKPVSLSPMEQLGAAIVFDDNLSEPAGQACADCHDPRSGFADRVRSNPVSEGVIAGMFGGRNAPSWAYTAWSPILHFDETEGLWIGGMFWDGRATGEKLGSPLADQAQGPFLADVEMHNASNAEVIRDISTSEYADLFLQEFPGTVWEDVDQAYDNMALAIAAYESSQSVNRFNSRFDAYMTSHKGALTAKEKQGLKLFNGKAKCNLCHPSEPTKDSTDIAEGKALFTDHTYDNLGLPANPTVWALTENSDVDYGLGGFLKREGKANWADEIGKFKVPTLRNVAKTRPYGHNGYFKTLYDIVHFYNTRDVPGAGWAVPEVPETVNTDELGDLGLTKREELRLVAFMKTLTDRTVMPQPAH